MKTVASVVSMLSVLVLVGAGCASTPIEEPSEINEELEAAIRQQNEGAMEIESSVTLAEITAIPTSFPGVLPVEERVGKTAVIKTERGDITVALEGSLAPKTVSNFIALAHTGFYDGLTFHRREEGFVIQGGDPNGNGSGGPGYTVDAEIVPQLKHDAYVIATARLGDQVNPTRASSGSQFYITLAEAPFLDGAYTVFGRVIDGTDVVDAIQVGDEIVTIEVGSEK